MPDALSTLESVEAASASADQALDASPVTTELEQPIIAPNEAKVIDPSAWHYDEGIPGAGEQPDWLMGDKYRNVSEQAKAYPEIFKKFGEFNGAPKEGYQLEKYTDKIDQGSSFLKDITDWAQNINMSQAGLESGLDMFIKYEEMNRPNPEEFVKSLTPEQHEMARKVIGWATNNFSEDEYGVIANWLTDPTALAILAKMRGMDRETKIPRIEGGAPIPTIVDVQSLIYSNYDQYKNDEAYRARLDKQMAVALEREGKI